MLFSHIAYNTLVVNWSWGLGWGSSSTAGLLGTNWEAQVEKKNRESLPLVHVSTSPKALGVLIKREPFCFSRKKRQEKERIVWNKRPDTIMQVRVDINYCNRPGITAHNHEIDYIICMLSRITILLTCVNLKFKFRHGH